MREIKLNKQSQDIVDENIKKLRELFPEIVVEDKVDFNRLQEILGKYIERNEESYRFSWYGKSDAFRKSQAPSTGTLRPCVEESKNWDTTQNLYIEGDNLEVLKLLQKSYGGQVKMIYIDPPYNKNKDFVYSDKWSDPIKEYKRITGQVDDDGLATTSDEDSQGGRWHTNWLNMIYPRLRLARHLLTDDGVIFISIDDEEVHNLRKICDEIFGEENFVAEIIWKRKRGRDNSAKWFSKSHEYLIVYAFKKELFETNFLQLDEETIKAYKNTDNDNRGVYRMLACWARGTQGGVEYDFTSKSGQYFKKRLWLFSKANLEKMDSEDRLIIIGDNVYRKLFLNENKGKIPETLWDNVSNAANASDEIKKIFDDILFDTPKPVPYITEMLRIVSQSSDTILDFFSGSSTTAHAVMQLNAEDGGNRKFIMVQLPELCEEKTEAYKAGYKNICEIGKERIRRAGDKIKSELTEKYDAYKKKQATVADMLEGEEGNAPMNPDNLDIGFKVLKLDSSNLERWALDVGDDFYTLDKENQNEIISSKLGLQVNNFVAGREDIDMLYEVMLKYGLDLSLPIDTYTFDKKNVYCIGAGALFVSFADELDESFADAIVAKVRELEPATVRVVVKDLAFVFDDRKTNFRETLKIGIAHYFAESNNSNKENQFEFITI